MFPHSSFTRGEATPRGLHGTRTPVRVPTPIPVDLDLDAGTMTVDMPPPVTQPVVPEEGPMPALTKRDSYDAESGGYGHQL